MKNINWKAGRITRGTFAIAFIATLLVMSLVTFLSIKAYMTHWLPSPVPEAAAAVSLFGATVITVILCAARLRDMGWSVWWAWLPLSPILSLLIFPVLFFWPTAVVGRRPSGKSRI